MLESLGKSGHGSVDPIEGRCFEYGLELEHVCRVQEPAG